MDVSKIAYIFSCPGRVLTNGSDGRGRHEEREEIEADVPSMDLTGHDKEVRRQDLYPCGWMYV